MSDRPVAGLTWNTPFPSQRAVDDSRAREQARAKFKSDAKKAESEYEAERAATLLKTERLRALRLARDAAAQQADQTAKPKAKTRAKRQKAPVKAG
jgi:hypothetical protein